MFVQLAGRAALELLCTRQVVQGYAAAVVAVEIGLYGNDDVLYEHLCPVCGFGNSEGAGYALETLLKATPIVEKTGDDYTEFCYNFVFAKYYYLIGKYGKALNIIDTNKLTEEDIRTSELKVEILEESSIDTTGQ